MSHRFFVFRRALMGLGLGLGLGWSQLALAAGAADALRAFVQDAKAEIGRAHV